MAFPVFHEVTPGSTTSITDTFTVSWPATVNAGDELFLFISNDGNRAITGAETAGWTLVSSYTYSLKKASLFHIASAAGTETGTFDVTLTPSGFEGASWGIARFSGTDGTLHQYTETDGNSVSADPPASAVPTGGAKDYLFLAIANAFNQPVVTVFPTNYINTGQVSASTGGTTSAWATRALNTAVAEDPSTFTLGVSNPWHAGVIIVHPDAGSAPVISSPTPTGTLGTQTTATLGATTDTTTGTFYGVVDTAVNISGITASQVKLGNNNGDVAAIGADNNLVTDTSPTADITGLTASTLYSYAVVHNTGDGDSNVLTGTFTTAAAVRSVDTVTGVMSYGAIGVVINTSSFTGPITAVTLGGESLTITDSSSSPTVTVPNNIQLQADISTYDLVVTESGGNATLSNQALALPAGYEKVVLSAGQPAEPSESVQELALNDHSVVLITGDEAYITTDANVTWATDGTFVIDPSATETGTYYAWDVNVATLYGPAAYTLAQIPILTSIGLTSTGSTTQTGSFDTDVGSGTGYGYWSLSATPPNAIDIKAGTGAVFADSITVLTVGSQTIDATGLSSSVTYYFHALQTNSGVDSDIVTSAGVATIAGNSAPVFAGTVTNQADARNIEISDIDLSTYFTDVDGDTLTYSVTTGVLPTGLNLDPNTGIISGPPTVLGTTAALVITATDPDLATDVTNSFSWEITNLQPVINDRSLNALTGSVAGTEIGTIGGTDGNSDVLSYTILAGNTGGDLALNSGTGVLSVAALHTLNSVVTDTYTLTVQADDQTGELNATDTATITVRVLLSLSTTRPSFSRHVNYVNSNVLLRR